MSMSGRKPWTIHIVLHSHQWAHHRLYTSSCKFFPCCHICWNFICFAQNYLGWSFVLENMIPNDATDGSGRTYPSPSLDAWLCLTKIIVCAQVFYIIAQHGILEVLLHCSFAMCLVSTKSNHECRWEIDFD